MPLDLHQLMKDLSAKRSVFHSEADFQHELAWQIRMQHQDQKIRLEYPAFGIGRQNDVLDIWVEDTAGCVSAIEVKYITHNLNALINGESFDLVDQAATSQKRFDYLEDIRRLESLLTGTARLVGYALFLTNNHGYWNSNARSAKGDAFPHTFREGETVSGQLAWKPGTNKETRGPRAESLTLTGRYTMNWRPYATVQGTGRSEFCYVLVTLYDPVTSPGALRTSKGKSSSGDARSDR